MPGPGRSFTIGEIPFREKLREEFELRRKNSANHIAGGDEMAVLEDPQGMTFGVWEAKKLSASVTGDSRMDPS